MANNRYTYFNPKLRDNTYQLGDAYDDEKFSGFRAQWRIPHEDMPYLQHVKQLEAAWPHLCTLTDFMEIGTTPSRWNAATEPPPLPPAARATWATLRNRKLQRAPPIERDLEAKEGDADQKKGWFDIVDDFQNRFGPKQSIGALDRETRWKVTKVCRLDYPETGSVRSSTFTTPETLRNEGLAKPSADDDIQFRLYVVEDLSRDVIEILGAHFHVDPSFFRAHIVDFAWSNVRDRFRDPPNLRVVSKHQSWTQFRYATARYYATSDEFKKGCDEAEAFNVQRRPDDDLNNIAFWDDENAKVGVSRARASLWVQDSKASDGPGIGILVLDPTIKAGKPLWGQGRNWETPPHETRQDRADDGTGCSDIFFDRFIHWAMKRDVFSKFGLSPSPEEHHADLDPWRNAQFPSQVLMHLICSEWLTMSDYIKARLNVIDLEIALPQHFLPTGKRIDTALTKLSTWRRWVPLYREMISETLELAFDVSPRPGMLSEGDTSSRRFSGCGAYKREFGLIYASMEECQMRIDRLTTVATAFISIEDSRRSIEASRVVGRLTWLATIFIPLSFVATFLSMQADLTGMEGTIKTWAAVSFTIIGVMLIFIFLTTEMVTGWIQVKVKPRFDAIRPWLGLFGKILPWAGWN